MNMCCGGLRVTHFCRLLSGIIPNVGLLVWQRRELMGRGVIRSPGGCAPCGFRRLPLHSYHSPLAHRVFVHLHRPFLSDYPTLLLSHNKQSFSGPISKPDCCASWRCQMRRRCNLFVFTRFYFACFVCYILDVTFCYFKNAFCMLFSKTNFFTYGFLQQT